MSFFKNHKITEGDYQFDEIQMLDAIGTGNSSVYEARVRGKPMAVKEIIIKNEEEVRLVHRQIKLMKELSQANDDIIRYEGSLFTVREVGPYNKMRLAYIIMEQGLTSLESVIQRKIKLGQVFRSDEIESLLKVLLRVFLFLQKRNIAHCDIKPQNVIIMSIDPLKIKICDIGSCRVITGQATEWSTLVGTVPFLAPELIRNYMSTGCANNPFKSDVFSLGLCIIYLTTFKKFKSTERLKIDEPIYREVIGQWVKEAKQRRCYDRVIWELLDTTLEFDEAKRVQFQALNDIFNTCIELRDQQRREQIKFAQKKLEENTQEVKLLEKFSSCQETFASKDKSKEKDHIKDRSLTKTNGFRSTRTRYIKPESTKVSNSSKQTSSKEDSSRFRLPRIPIQTIMTPFLKKQSVGSSNFTEIQSPTRSKKSSSIDISNNLIVVNKNVLANSQQTIISNSEKFIILNCWYWGFQYIKALCVNMRCDFKLSAMLININKLFTLTTLVLNIDGYDGEPVKDLDTSDNLTEITNLTISAKKIEFENYKSAFKFLMTRKLRKVTLVLSHANICLEDLIWLLQTICQSQCTKLVMFLDNIQLDDKGNRMITDILAKSKLCKLYLYLGQNRIDYTKEFPWPLPKSLSSLELDYSDNRIGVALSSLSLNLLQMKAELRQLILDLRHCSITTKQLNCLFSCISKIELETVVLRLSENEFDDSAMKFVSKALMNMSNLVNFEFEFQHTLVTTQGWALVVQAADKLFRSRAAHIRISFDRFARKQQLSLQVKRLMVRNQTIKDDYLLVDNDYFSVFLRKRPLPIIKIPKNKTFCTRLFASCPTQNHYLCLTCKAQRQLCKYKYFCEFCAVSCAHKGHNIIRLFSPEVCSCAFSGQCKSDINDWPCSKLYHQLYQKKYECLKCNCAECCIGCIVNCKKNHEDFVKESRNPGEFECKLAQTISYT